MIYTTFTGILWGKSNRHRLPSLRASNVTSLYLCGSFLKGLTRLKSTIFLFTGTGAIIWSNHKDYMKIDHGTKHIYRTHIPWDMISIYLGHETLSFQQPSDKHQVNPNHKVVMEIDITTKYFTVHFDSRYRYRAVIINEMFQFMKEKLSYGKMNGVYSLLICIIII